jgi:glutathione synthase/RimK-type ligase-like ATP-grasp enzyme
MANEPQITQLKTAELLFKSALSMGLNPSWITNGGPFAITTANGERIINSSCSPLNTHVSASLSRNKFHTRMIMERSNLPNIPFIRPKTIEEAAAFLDEHGTIIVKPVSGSGASNILIVTDMAQIDDLKIRRYIFEKYIVGKEMRYLVLNDRVIAVHQAEYGTSVAVDRLRQQFSYGQSEWDPALVSLARRIARAIGLQFAAVDFLIDKDGTAYILEVNSRPDLKWFHAPTTGPIVDVAGLFLGSML